MLSSVFGNFAVPSIYAADIFLEEANLYLEKICTKGKVRGIDAVVCSFAERISQLEVVDSSIQERLESIEEQLAGPGGQTKTIKAYDATGAELGIAVNDDSFFYPPLDRFVRSRY